MNQLVLELIIVIIKSISMTRLTLRFRETKIFVLNLVKRFSFFLQVFDQIGNTYVFLESMQLFEPNLRWK